MRRDEAGHCLICITHWHESEFRPLTSDIVRQVVRNRRLQALRYARQHYDGKLDPDWCYLRYTGLPMMLRSGCHALVHYMRTHQSAPNRELFANPLMCPCERNDRRAALLCLLALPKYADPNMFFIGV